ncbi:nitronate monooxygenase [Catenulispora sp. NF23]|uniref:NAD(P)H-dependent flavin oxidoreductase n=1 Tax=Catenulispora pinistramenti TaxID=2705254 RepID=UPI001BA55F5D|nr:nitronate monooxygenase [Catenulispora pinistramenti]MBS2534839.1 nitronate monooxygenase [Catenulispora pinistramenti]
MTGFLESELPIVAAPMAGGPTTVALVGAVQGAGAFPFLAGGYKKAEALAAEVRQVRELGGTFGVNLFVPGTDAVDAAAFRAYAAELAPEAAPYGLELNPQPVVDDDDEWPDKLALLLAEPVPVVSLTFGLPDVRDIAALRRVGSRVLATVTTAAEAKIARDAGVDGLVVQAPAAGGHSGTYDPLRTLTPVSAPDLVREVRAAVELPVVVGGGVASAEDVRVLLAAGAEAVAVGTLLLRTDESGASQTHKDALAAPIFAETTITHAFTGRPARGLRNGFIDRHETAAPYGYPAIHHLTRPLRQAAAKAGDADRLHLWAGTGFRAAREVPAAEVIQELARGL